MKNKVVYIAHPVGGDVAGNIEKIINICREIHLQSDNIIPFAPYLLSLQYLDDNIPEERELGMRADKEYFKRKAFDELWVYGDLSAGVKKEIKCAEEYGIPIVYKKILE